ncbi:hypothetical protein ONE63_002707 [Megalurothrips usitatus]|uniref:PHD-type domain-containing protein n=1 Tax=Megalurothrips usitatus TaxID=439358 RepID=A0AAV7XCQ8_9NEOP|nr:hypothetical protein ONE63_002707 [Megalurothrips usitatus]
MTTEVTSGVTSAGGQELQLQITSNDVGTIQDEDLLRRMWQQTEDFGRKKEIRARMYKLREQRLKDFYTTGEVVRDIGDSQQIIARKASNASFASMTDSGEVRTHSSHTESIQGQGGFMHLKSKEIRDSESPTRDMHRRQQHQDYTSSATTGATTGTWKVVRESTSSAYDSANDLGVVTTSSRSEQSGTTSTALTAAPTGMHLVDANETVIHNPDGSVTRRQSATHESGTTTTTTSSTRHAAQQRTATSAATSSRTVTTSKTSSTSTTGAVVDQPGVTITEVTSTSSSTSGKRGSVGEATHKTSSTTTSHLKKQNQSGVDQKIMTEISKLDSYLSTQNATGSTNTPASPRSVCSEAALAPSAQQAKTEFSFETSTSSSMATDRAVGTATTKQESKRVSSTTSTTSSSSDLDATRQAKVTQDITITPSIADSHTTTVTEQRTTTRLENEQRAADQSCGTRPSATTPATVTKREQRPRQEAPARTPVDADQYVTTYAQSYNSKRVSQDLSPTHQYFASALRASPTPTSARATPTRSIESRGSVDRETTISSRPSSRPSSPRKGSRGTTPDNSRASPVKERPRVQSPTKSTTSTTTSTFDSSTIRRSSTASKDKRRFTSSASRAATKKRSGTPGASPRSSPRASPVRDRPRSVSPASSTADDSDACVMSGRRRSNSKTSVSSSATWTRELTRKSSSETLKGSTSKETSPVRDEVTPKASPQPTPAPSTPSTPLKPASTREKSPEYSSDGSLASELFQRHERGERTSPDRFTPIKCFRTIPEGGVLEPKKDKDGDSSSTTQTRIDASSSFIREETRRRSQPAGPGRRTPTPQSSSVSPCTSPERSPVRPTAPAASPKRDITSPSTSNSVPRSPASSPERSPVRKPAQPKPSAPAPSATRIPSSRVPSSPSPTPTQPQRPRDTSAPTTTTRKVPTQRRSSSSSPERPKTRPAPKRTVETRTPSASSIGKRPLADKTNLRAPASGHTPGLSPSPARPAKAAHPAQTTKSAFVRTTARPQDNGNDTRPRTASRTPSAHRLYGGMTLEVCGVCHLKLGAEKDTVQCTSECRRKFHVRCVASGEEIKLVKIKKNWRCVRCGGEATTKTTSTTSSTTKTTTSVTKTLGHRRSSEGVQRQRGPAAAPVPADSGAESDRSSAASPTMGKVSLSDIKTTTTNSTRKESRDRVDLASLCGVATDIKNISTGDYYSDLENEAPPEEFLVDDDDEDLDETITSTKTTKTKRVDHNEALLESERRHLQKTKQDSRDLFTRTSSDRSVLKKTTTPAPAPKRQSSKPELSTGSGSGRPFGGAVAEVCGVCHLKLGAEKDTVQCTSECHRKFHVRCVASGEDIKLVKLKKNWRCVRCGGTSDQLQAKKTLEKDNSRGKLTVKVDKKQDGGGVSTERRGSTTTTTTATTTKRTASSSLTNGHRREESFTSGDETDVPNADKTATPTGVDSYMWELDDMRRRQEEQYARKVTDKENILLTANVHVQLPKSSRESSPDGRGRGPGSVCTAGDESDSSRPRYADRVSEPGSDDEGPGPRQGSVNKLPQLDERRSSEQRELDRERANLEDDDENDVANLSVSDKVRK